MLVSQTLDILEPMVWMKKKNWFQTRFLALQVWAWVSTVTAGHKVGGNSI
jgi:hypothetical protein